VLMPEASVHENDLTETRQNKVGCSRQVRSV
jgi:hypothetical protein